MSQPLLASTLTLLLLLGHTHTLPSIHSISHPVLSQNPTESHNHQNLHKQRKSRRDFLDPVFGTSLPHHWLTDSSATYSTQLVSVASLLQDPGRYHQTQVTVRGTISQPEMHLDETELFFNFVFLLKEDDESIVVFGRHDRTQGGSVIAMGNTVEVSGIFWKDRIAHDYHFKNNLEAITVSPYPSLTPDRT